MREGIVGNNKHDRSTTDTDEGRRGMTRDTCT